MKEQEADLVYEVTFGLEVGVRGKFIPWCL
jgi:hypothetical protein